MRKNRLKIAALACACLLFTGLKVSAATTEVNNFTSLQSAIEDAVSGTVTDITLTGSIINATAGISSKSGTEIVLNGGSNSISSDGADHRGFNIVEGSTFTINDTSISGFIINQTSANQRDKGGAITSNGRLTVNGSTFTGNKTLNNNEPKGTVVMGGAIYTQKGVTYINSSFFNENEARRGGAIASEDNSSSVIVIDSSSFQNNKSGFAGGALSNGGLMSISNSDFKGNTAEYSSDTYENGGGAISNSGTLYLQETTFTGNISNRNGGAVLNRSNSGSNVVFTGYNEFFGNKADVASTLDKTLNGGGAIYNSNKMTIGDLDVNSSAFFTQNSTTAAGGAIYNKGDLNINSHATFTANHSGFSGGAVANTGNLTFNSGNSKNQFLNNTSGGNGGALANIGTMTVIGETYYKGNSATLNGGAIYNSSKITIDGTATFEDNSSGGSGGAIYNTGNLTISGTASFTGNKASATNENSGGGAIYNSATLNIFGTRSGDITSTAASIIFENNSLMLNSNSTGGAIHVNADLFLTGADFIGNKATRAGAIRGEGGGAGDDLYINDAKFLNNEADRYGGAISSAGTANIYVSNSYFNGNKVTTTNGGMGGAVTNGGNLTILNSTFLNNSATNHGGAVSFNGNQMTILADGADTIFSGNTTTSSASGEGLFIYTNGTPTINFNAGNGNNIRFDDKILYSKNNSSSTEILDVNLNQSNIFYNHFEEILQGAKAATAAPTNGNIIFNNNVKNMNLVLHNGTLKIGDDSSFIGSNNYFTNSSITLNGGTLDLSNGNIESGNKLKLNNLLVNGDANLEFDIDLDNNLIDYINTTITGNGSLTIDKIDFTGQMSGNLGESKNFNFAAGNEVNNTLILDSLKTVITSDAGYGLDLTTTNNGKDTLSITKVVNAGGLPIAVSIGEFFDSSTYVYSATSDETIVDWNVGFQVLKEGIISDATASNILKGSELVINGNNKNIITTTAGLDGISLSSGQTLSVNSVAGWEGFNSAIINNGGQVNIKNSIFNANTSTTSGGAIRNTANGVLKIENSSFTNNTADVNGGAIYNEGTVDISANNASKINFSGNSSDIHNENGTLNLSADQTSSITFNGKITGTDGIINITDTNLGSVIFNNTVANSTVSLNNGTLHIGADASVLAAGDKYFDNVALNLQGGTLNLQNGKIDTIDVTSLTINNNPNILLDFNLSSDQNSDKINAGSVNSTGTLWVGPINITEKMASGTTSVVSDFINESITTAIEDVNKSITVDGVVYAVDVAGSQITVTKQGESGGLAYEVINDAHPERTFIVGKDAEKVNQWINGDNNLAGTRLQIMGGSNGQSIIGNKINGISLTDGQQLDITNVASYEGFLSAVINKGGTVNITGTKFSNNINAVNGGALKNNSGIINIDGGSIFSSNSATEKGGAIYNNGTLSLNTFATAGTYIGDIVFENNTAVEGADIYQTAAGITNITGDNGGSITFNGGIAGLGKINKSGNGNLILNGDNSEYKGYFTQDGAIQDGTVVNGGTTTVNAGAKFFGGETVINNSTLEWLTANDLDYSQIQKPKITINSGNLRVGGGAQLSIANGGSIADAVSVELEGSLISHVNMTVNGNFTGNGTFTAENITLNINGDNSDFEGKFVQNNGSTIVNADAVLFKDIEINDGELKFLADTTLDGSTLFTSTNTTVTITSNNNAGAIISAINSGTNTNLNITLDGSDSNADLFIDGTNIKEILFTNNIEYSGAITGSGTVINEGTLLVKGDESGFNGTFNQTAGKTTIDIAGKVFGGDKNIQAGSLNITSADAIDYEKVHLSSGTALNHTTTSNIENTISSNVVDFISGASGAEANFTAAGEGVIGNFYLAENIDNGNLNTISFENSKVTLGTTDYTGNTDYALNNSTLDLTKDSGLGNYEFSSLTTNGNNKLDFNIEFDATNPDKIVLNTDTLSTGSSAIFDVGKIVIDDAKSENGQLKYETSTDVLGGNASFSSATGSKVVSNGATTIYEYVVSVTDDNKSIELNATDFANENSLNKANTMEGNRFFHFSKEGTSEYHIGASLDPTKSGDFYVTGKSDNASESVLSGALVDSTGALTGDYGSFFNISSDKTTNLYIEDLTVQDAQKTGNGSVVENNSSTSTITLDNTVINNNSATGSGGAIYNDGGTVNISNSSFNNNSAGGDGGAIYNTGILNLSNTTLAKGTDSAKNDIYSTGEINFSNTNNINSSISGTGSIKNEGTLNLNGDNSGFTGTFKQTAGITNVADKFFGGTSTITNGILNWNTTSDLPSGGTLIVNNGQLNVGNNNIKSALTLGAGSSIANDAITNIYKNSTLNIDGAEVNLNANDGWAGKINLTDGELNLDSLKGNGVLTASDGSINLDKGKLTVGQGSSILEAVTTAISDKTTLGITGNGTVELDASDSWVGNIVMNNGSLKIDNITSNGKLQASDGKVELAGGELAIGEGSYIAGAVDTIIDTSSTININGDGTDPSKGGLVQIDNNDTWDGTIILNGGTLNYAATQSGTLKADKGFLNLLDGSVLTVEIPSQIANAVDVDIRKGAEVNITNGGIFNLDARDKWNGLIKNDGGELKTTGLVNNGGGGLQQTGGSSIFTDNSHIYIVDPQSYITGGNVSVLNNSSLYLGPDILEFEADKLTLAGNSALHVMNGVLDEPSITDMTVNDTNNVSIDIAARTHEGDTFIIDNLQSDSSGVLNISDFNFIGLAPIDREINLQVFNANNISDVDFTATDKGIFTPIGNYQLFSNGGGSYTARLTSYNPQVYRGQVATLAMYNNQLMIDDMLLNHVSLQSERLLAQGQNANKYAATLPQFAPYQYKQEDGGLWFKSYVNFETLSMTNNLNVGNNSYGSLVGADFPVVDLANGWKFLPTAYIAYNGGNQNFNNVSMVQNGGQGGFMGTFMKDNFIGSILAYAGGYSNEMQVAGYTDNTGNWFAGTAAKAAYNLRATKHFTIQPTAFISYNIFGKQNWNTDFGVMSMNSGLLNGINVAPGLNLIYARETWSIYGTIQYMFNINDQIGGRAGNVALDNIKMRHGYIQYGIGATKTWKDRLNSYVQVTLRNGGRTGIGFQLGLQYLFDWYNPHKKQQITNVPKTKTVIKSLN